MSKLIQFEVDDDSYTSYVGYSLKYQDPVTNLQYQDKANGMKNIFVNEVLVPARRTVPPAAVIAAQIVIDNAVAAMNALAGPTVEDVWFQFHLDATNPASIVHGGSGSAPFNVTTLDPAYLGTINVDLLDISGTGSGITGIATPSTFTAAGSGSMALTVPGGCPPGSYDLMVRGIDADGVRMYAVITLIVT